MIALRSSSCGVRTCVPASSRAVHRRLLPCFSTNTDNSTATATQDEVPSTSGSGPDLGKEINKFAKTTAAFAPRSSTASKNPAVKGSLLYQIFEVQAWVTLAAGGLLSFNIIFPTDQPDIPRLMGMWAIWMFTIPSLRAKECTPREKDALNYLFAGMPLLNILIPFVSKSFPVIFCADVAMLVGIYWWKGVWQEVYGIPFMMAGALDTAPPPFKAPASEEQQQQ